MLCTAYLRGNQHFYATMYLFFGIVIPLVGYYPPFDALIFKLPMNDDEALLTSFFVIPLQIQ